MILHDLFGKKKDTIKQTTIEEDPEYKADISVIVPFYNVEEYIDETIRSILAQKRVSLEIIFIDDGSTDGSVDIVRSYMADHDNMMLLESEHKGPGYARNLGIEHASGMYLAAVDSDDLLVPNIYKTMFRAAKRKNADLCICNAARFNSTRVWQSELHEKAFRGYKHCTHITETPDLIYDTTVWNKLIRRDFYIKQGIRFPEGILYEDVETSLMMHARSNKVVMIPETGYLWRVREAGSAPSISQQHYTIKNEEDRFKVTKRIVELFNREDLPSNLMKMFYYRVLETDLRLVLDTVTHVPDEVAGEIFSKVRPFVQNVIPEDAFEDLSLLDRQRYDCLRRNDIEGYRRLIDYRKEHYYKAPIKETDGKLLAMLPDDIFTIKERDVRPELSRMPRRTFIDRIEVSESSHSIRVFTHVYIQRYNMSEKGDLDVKVFVQNEETGKRIPVESTPEPTPFLTEAFGHVEDEGAGVASDYNYDWTGFSFSVDTEMFRKTFEANPKKNRRYAVIVKYSDRLFSGTQILHGVSENNKPKFEWRCVILDGLKLSVYFGAQDELIFLVRKDPNWPSCG